MAGDRQPPRSKSPQKGPAEHPQPAPSERTPTPVPSQPDMAAPSPTKKALPPPPTPPGPALPPETMVGKRPKSLWRRYRDYHYFNDPRLNRRPSIKSFIKARWIDYIVMILMVIAVELLYTYWRGNSNFEFLIIDPKLSHRWVESPIPIWAHALFVIGLPLVVFTLIDLFWIHSLWDWHNAVIGLGFALGGSVLVQLILKKAIGGLRPHFIDACQPDWQLVQHQLARSTMEGSLGMNRNLWYNKSICTQHQSYKLDEAFESFPSGHVTGSFASMIFLMLYLNGKVKIWSQSPSHGYKLALVTIPFILACLTAGIMFNSGWHHWHDIYVGIAIGTLFAFAAYRMAFASVWDPVQNHVPLLQHPFSEHHPPGADAPISGGASSISGASDQTMKPSKDKLADGPPVLPPVHGQKEGPKPSTPSKPGPAKAPTPKMGVTDPHPAPPSTTPERMV